MHESRSGCTHKKTACPARNQHPLDTYESKYYPDFIISNLEAMLCNVGIKIKIKEELRVLLGAGIVVKGTRTGFY